ncbi:hypothetical protein NLU13_9737 [Sarocladium strictum]|uniref:Uncharacterized protein n=1 Tax=Sarocladium strictum TaxID=5046 RepID=A0AA39GB08_SARSR|nr:hypothetical protein NLU13_8771 [Sarocladium strictum]KAK0383826.1 hypothetical protein NLU13_9737 [Sarocladium strictum]
MGDNKDRGCDFLKEPTKSPDDWKYVERASPVPYASGQSQVPQPEVLLFIAAMADPKNKAVNGNHAIDKTQVGSKAKVNGNTTASTPVSSPISPPVSPAERTNHQSKLSQVLSLLKDVADESEAISEYEKSIDVRKALEKDLAHKESEVQKLRDFNKDLMRELSECKNESASQSKILLSAFEQRYKVFDSNNTAVETMQAEVTEVKVKLEAAKVDAKNKQAEVEKLVKKLEETEKSEAAHINEIKELNAESELQRSKIETGATELASCKSKLATARADLGDDILREYGPDGLRKLGLELKALSKKCHALALEFFNDPDGAKDSVTEIAELKSRFPNIPLSTASTKAAAKLRCAAAEAVIADILTTHIFSPFYLSPDAKAAAVTLLDLFGDDERRRSVYRCQVLSSHQARGEEAARIEADIVRRASNEVMTTLHALVSAEKQAEFYGSNAVSGLFKDALKVWSEVQRARDPITAERPDLTESYPPGKYDEYDVAPTMSPRSPKGMPAAAGGSAAIPKGSHFAAVLFPQVVTREDIIFNGMVLWTHQTEAPTAPAASPPPPIVKTTSVNVKSMPPIVGGGEGGGGGGGGRRHQRRRSVVADEGVAFKGKQNGHGGGHANGGASVVVNGN